jgi:hypothetical protein
MNDIENIKFETAKETIDAIIGKRFSDITDLNIYVTDMLGFKFEANEQSNSKEDSEDIGSDYCLLAGINEDWGYVDIYYLLDNKGRMLITEVNVSEE